MCSSFLGREDVPASASTLCPLGDPSLGPLAPLGQTGSCASEGNLCLGLWRLHSAYQGEWVHSPVALHVARASSRAAWGRWPLCCRTRVGSEAWAPLPGGWTGGGRQARCRPDFADRTLCIGTHPPLPKPSGPAPPHSPSLSKKACSLSLLWETPPPKSAASLRCVWASTGPFLLSPTHAALKL